MTGTLPTPAVSLADFTGLAMVVPELRGRDASSIIQELSQALQREGRVQDLLPFYHAVLNREFLSSTDVETGIALPHARLPGLKSVSFALGRTSEPVLWTRQATAPVRLVFLMAVPATDATQYLLLISGLSRLAKDAALVEKLHAAAGAFQIMEILREVPLRKPPVPR
jgi:mannitol/fructose-specific phosphotransferase system IIA component (Ntr-type)